MSRKIVESIAKTVAMQKEMMGVVHAVKTRVEALEKSLETAIAKELSKVFPGATFEVLTGVCCGYMADNWVVEAWVEAVSGCHFNGKAWHAAWEPDSMVAPPVPNKKLRAAIKDVAAALGVRLSLTRHEPLTKFEGEWDERCWIDEAVYDHNYSVPC